MGVNAVYLMGLVAARPFRDPGRQQCTLLVVTAEQYVEVRERHRVVAGRELVGAASVLAVGQSVYITGSLQRDDSRRVIVAARELWPLTDTPEPASDAVVVGTHASPRERERTGHWRRVGITTPRERLVWVRPTTVSVRRA